MRDGESANCAASNSSGIGSFASACDGGVSFAGLEDRSQFGVGRHELRIRGLRWIVKRIFERMIEIRKMSNTFLLLIRVYHAG
jgi:hypothetical protein